MEMLEDYSLDVESKANALITLLCPSGGFAERPGQANPQTNATCAALAALSLAGQLDPAMAASSLIFLISTQDSSGGFRAHVRAPRADLLSTFSALVAFWSRGAIARIDLPALGRFVKECAKPTGGFLSGPLDPAPDIEYTYYGVASACLLRASATKQEGSLP
jgi:geranylgeranyl transferase type-2 subunit beta